MAQSLEYLLFLHKTPHGNSKLLISVPGALMMTSGSTDTRHACRHRNRPSFTRQLV